MLFYWLKVVNFIYQNVRICINIICIRSDERIDTIWCPSIFITESKILESEILESLKNAPRPGIEPGPPGWKPGILTPRPSGTDYTHIFTLTQCFISLKCSQNKISSFFYLIKNSVMYISDMYQSIWPSKLSSSRVNFLSHGPWVTVVKKLHFTF